MKAQKQVEFEVDANHASHEFIFKSLRAYATRNQDGTWYATAYKLGCGKDYATPEAAVRALLEANACDVMRMEVIQIDGKPRRQR